MYTSKDIIIFGNGLGMALDHEYFRLETAMQKCWDIDTGNVFDKELIKNCLPQGKLVPELEYDLDKVHLASICCDFLSSLPNPELWLKDQAQLFSRGIPNFIYFVSSYFHFYEKPLPSAFILSLINFVRDSNAHVATLNYDPLIYNPFCEEKVLVSSYKDTYLVDGLQKKRGFCGDNLIPRGENQFGLYLHLHGSPRFIEDKTGKIFKCDADDFYNGNINGVPGKHIVLTHIKHKKRVIGASDMLSTYWSFLELILSEINRLTLFGYSGEDEHLNKLIQKYDKPDIRVVEWSGAAKNTDRMKYWKRKTGRASLDLILEDDILKFEDW